MQKWRHNSDIFGQNDKFLDYRDLSDTSIERFVLANTGSIEKVAKFENLIFKLKFLTENFKMKNMKKLMKSTLFW